MRRALTSVALISAALFLAACGEKPQTNAHGVKVDAPPWTGTGVQPNTGTAFTASGWTPGDRASWEERLKTRMQYGQNEYNRIR